MQQSGSVLPRGHVPKLDGGVASRGQGSAIRRKGHRRDPNPPGGMAPQRPTPGMAESPKAVPFEAAGVELTTLRPLTFQQDQHLSRMPPFPGMMGQLHLPLIGAPPAHQPLLLAKF